MHIVVTSAIIANLFSIIVLLVGLFYTFKQPKNKANFGYSVVGCMLAYVVLLGVVVIRELMLKSELCFVVLAMCVISPFVIGKFVRYETLKKYTFIQILFFIVSLVTLLHC